jgi:hypothetical protein
MSRLKNFLLSRKINISTESLKAGTSTSTIRGCEIWIPDLIKPLCLRAELTGPESNKSDDRYYTDEVIRNLNKRWDKTNTGNYYTWDK